MSDKLVKIECDHKEVVVQHNSFLEAHKGLTLQEYKLFMFLISKVNPDSIEFTTFRVTALEFAKAIGVENSTYIYRDLQNVTKHLMERVVKIHKTESDLLIQTHLISSVYYWYGKGYVDIKISEDMAPYLLGLKRDFTQYKLSQITHLSSIYAMRVYELLKKQERLNTRTFFIDDLREKLGISSNTLKAFKDFRLHVLEIAKREINAKTDIKIDFKFIKSGRKITAIQFDIIPKNSHKEEAKKLYFLKKHNQPEHIKEIMDFGFSEKSATSMIDNLFDSDIENAVAAVKKQIAKGNVKNPKAMLKTALKEKWSTNKTDYEKLEKSKKVNEEHPKIIQKRSTFMKVFDSLFKR